MNDNASSEKITVVTFTDKIAAIERYLSRGWAVFPVAAGGKTPAIASPHPRDVRCRGRVDGCVLDGHGCLDATTDRLAVLRWWSAPIHLNIGIATGAPSDHWVLDYDPRAAGREASDLASRLHGEGRPAHVRTGRGGGHWRFDLPADFEVTNRRGTLPAGLDVRGTGGYVVAPPSVSEYGAYVELPTPGDGTPYEAPGWLLGMIRPAAPLPRSEPPAGWSVHSHAPVEAGTGSGNDRGQRYAAAAVADMLAELAATPANRNDLAWRTACRILEFVNAGWLNLPDVDQAWVDSTASHPLGIIVPNSEIMSIWSSAMRHVGGRPAEMPPEWTDPLRVEVWPSPPTDKAGVPPFSPNSHDGASMFVMPAFSEPGVAGGAGAATGNGPSPDYARMLAEAREKSIREEVGRILVRDEAKRRIREMEAGNRATIAARLRGELIDTPALLARPRPVPVVDGLLFRNTLVRIVGKPGAGKTHVTFDLVAHVAAGMAWAGRRTHATRGAYVVAEGDGGFGGRVEAWQVHHGRAAEIIYLPRAVQIGGPEWDAWCDVMREDGYGLVTIDTQARATVGRDEIDGRDSGEVVAALDRLRVATGALVLLVHHTNMSGGTTGRGHGGILGALDVELYVSATVDGRVITVKGGKSKDTAKPEDMIFDLVDVPAPARESMPGFSEPGPAAVLGVVPVWRGGAVESVDVRQSARTVRARQLWQVIHDRYNPGMGGTQAEIKAAWADVAWPGRPTSGAAANGFRKAWARAWADLIQRGLLAKAYGASRFKVVVLADQSADGVLTPNRKDEQLISEGPDGFEVILTEVTEREGDL